MKHSSLFAVALMIAVGAASAGCGDNQDEAGAQALLSKIRAANYRGWSRPVGFETRKGSSAPHGEEVDIFMNDVVKNAISAKKPLSAWPEGAIMAKDGFDSGDLNFITVMEKRKDGWFYAEFDEDGDPKYSGKPDLCIDCHKGGQDMLFSVRLPTK